jgi:sugar-specific transcriptional regulator TrmB
MVHYYLSNADLSQKKELLNKLANDIDHCSKSLKEKWMNIEDCKEKMKKLKLDVKNGDSLLEKLCRRKKEIEEIIYNPLVRTVEVIKVGDANHILLNGLVDVNRDILMRLIKIIHDDDKTKMVIEFYV